MSGTRRRVLLDECLPNALRHDLAMFDVQTAQYAGLAGFKNGALIAAINGRFDVFVTVDRNPQFQQNLSSITFGVVVLRLPTNRLPDIRSALPKLQNAVATIASGQIQTVI
jgi:hypothetical protein